MAYTTIDDPSAHFHIQLYSGDSNDNRDITNDANAGDFQPDWLWIKERTSTSSHQLIDSSNGARYALLSDSTGAQDDDQNRVQAFNSDGFQVGTASTVNANGDTYIAYQWKLNAGTTSSDSSGDLTATVQANQTAGFSVVKFTTNGDDQSIAHGLGGKPDMVWLKPLTSANWIVIGKFDETTFNNKYMLLHDTDARGTDGSYNEPTSTLFSTSNNISPDAAHTAFCFRSIQGYSRIHHYHGNGNADGTFVYCGFKPAWVLVKQIDGADNWQLVDNKRDPNNVAETFFSPDTTAADTTHANNIKIDLLSTGFKCRGSNSIFNASGNEYMFMAFAEHPFVTSTGTPTTARVGGP